MAGAGGAIKTAIVLFNLAILPGVVIGAAVMPHADAAVAVIVSPFAGPAAVYDVIARAGGRIVAPARMPFIAVAWSPDGDFPQRLRAAGALLVLDGHIAAICGRAEGAVP